MTRKLNAIEINQSQKAGIDPFSIDMEKLGDMPIEYYIGETEFHNRMFKVDQNVLIPRIESEKLIDLAVENLEPSHKRITFCDVGTGSGVLGITFGLELQKRNIKFNGYLSDVSSKALDIARINAELLFDVSKKSSKKGLYNIDDSKIEILESNLLENYNKALRFDFIFANLPYIPRPRMPYLPNSVKKFEPEIALDGGTNGLDLIISLLIQAYTRIKKNGIVIMEVDDTHGESTWEMNEFDEDRDFWTNSILEDENGKTRYWVLRKK